MEVFYFIRIFIVMISKITRKILKEEITDKVLKYVKKFAGDRDDYDWDDVKKHLEENLGFSQEESMLLILKTLTAEDTPWDEDPLDIFDFYIWYKAFGSETVDILKDHSVVIDIQFSDTFNVGDKIYLRTDGLCDFKKLFKYDDDEHMAEKLYCDEDWFEMWDFSPTFEESWDTLNKKCIEYIKSHLKETFLNKKITLEEPDDLEEYLDEVPEEYEGERTITLTSDKIDKLSDNELKTLIENGDEFEDNLRYEITWAYESAYNNVGTNEISNKLTREIEDVFGKGEWKSKTVKKNGKDVQSDELIFDITSIYNEYINNYITERGEIPSDQYTYFIELAKEVLDDTNSLLSTGINYGYFYPDIDGDDMYEELTNRF